MRIPEVSKKIFIYFFPFTFYPGHYLIPGLFSLGYISLKLGPHFWVPGVPYVPRTVYSWLIWLLSIFVFLSRIHTVPYVQQALSKGRLNMIDGIWNPGECICFYSGTENSCRLTILRLIFSSYHNFILVTKGMVVTLSLQLKKSDNCT